MHGTFESRLCLFPLGRPVSRKACKTKKRKLKSLVFLCRESNDSARTLSNWLYFSRPQYRFLPSPPPPPTPPFQCGATWYWLAGMEVNVRTSYHAEYCKDNSDYSFSTTGNFPHRWKPLKLPLCSKKVMQATHPVIVQFLSLQSYLGLLNVTSTIFCMNFLK